MQSRLLVEVLAGVAQVELELSFDCRDAGEPLRGDGWLLVAKGGVRPLPQQRAVGAGHTPRRVQVVGRDRLEGGRVLDRRDGHRARGRGQPEVVACARRWRRK